MQTFGLFSGNGDDRSWNQATWFARFEPISQSIKLWTHPIYPDVMFAAFKQ